MAINVVIFTDASFCHKTGAGGWAAWVKTSGQRGIIHGGAFKTAYTRSDTAELAAIANGCAMAKKLGLLTGTVMIQSDCTVALAIVRHRTGAVDSKHADGIAVPVRRTQVPKEALPVATQIKTMLAGCKVIVRHVRGHTEGDGRQWVNRQCDSIAGQHMRASRQQLRKGDAATPISVGHPV